MYLLLAMNTAQYRRREEARAAKKNIDEDCPKCADLSFYAATHVRLCKRRGDAEHRFHGYCKIGLAV